MKKMLPLFAGITLLAGVSAANAGEPMQLTTAQMDKVTAAGDYTSVAVNTSIKESIHLIDTKLVLQKVYVEGHVADAKAAADAYGCGTQSVTLTTAQTTPYNSSSFSQSTAVSQ